MKILVIAANAFSKIYNNGKTLEAIFSSFNPDELAQLFTRPQDSAFTDYEFCNEYYVVSEMDIINRLLGKSKQCGGKLEIKIVNYESSIYNKFKRKSIKKIGLLRDILWGTGLWKTKNLNNWVQSINVDLVFVVGGGSKYLHSLALYISDFLKVPICVFYTDDYLLHPIFRGPFGVLNKIIMRNHYKKIISKSAACFSIGSMMSKEYGEYFKKEFYPIMNSLSIEDYIDPVPLKLPNIIAYFGGLHLNRWRMIARVGMCLPDGWKIHLYTSSEINSEIKNTFEKSNVVIKGCVSGLELRDKMVNSKVLLHVESDDKINRALTYLSVSTKIPEYLMSGRAIIGFGPQEVSSMHVLTDNNIGYGLSSSLSIPELKDYLYSILNNNMDLIEMGKQAYKYALENYNREKNANAFKDKLKEIIFNT